ncbi:serine/threonine protein kinase [Nanoarchaeota archaeon]
MAEAKDIIEAYDNLGISKEDLGDVLLEQINSEDQDKMKAAVQNSISQGLVTTKTQKEALLGLFGSDAPKQDSRSRVGRVYGGKYKCTRVVDEEGGEGVLMKVIAGDKYGALKEFDASKPHQKSRIKDSINAQKRVPRSQNLANYLDDFVDGGRIYLLTDWKDGLTEDEILRRSVAPLSPMDVSAILRGGALGARDLHNSDVVHRDYNPTNLIIDENGIIATIDITLAKDPLNEEHYRTGTGSGVVGTLIYSSKEQLKRAKDIGSGKKDNSTDVTPRTDVYQLGLIGLKSLTGIDLFYGDKQVEIKKKIMRGVSSPKVRHLMLSRNPYRDSHSGPARKLYNVICKALKRKYRNGGEMLQDLNVVLDSYGLKQPLIDDKCRSQMRQLLRRVNYVRIN